MLGYLYFTENVLASNIDCIAPRPGSYLKQSLSKEPHFPQVFCLLREAKDLQDQAGARGHGWFVSQECLEILYMLCCYVILFLTFSIFILTQKSIKKLVLMSQDVGIEFLWETIYLDGDLALRSLTRRWEHLVLFLSLILLFSFQ